MKSLCVAVVVIIQSSCPNILAFTLPSTTTTLQKPNTQLSMMTPPPPMIIGPMLRKMREEKEKKNAPLASDEEKMGEAPGLRVGENTWKWPPVWPYDRDMFRRKDDIEKEVSQNALSGLSNLVGGGAGAGGMTTPPSQVTMDGLDGGVEEEKKKKEEEDGEFDVLKYWQEEKGDVRTEMEEAGVENLRSHFRYYLRNDMSVIELGAAEDSYLPSPDIVRLSRHVGIGANMKLMEENPSLSERYVVDLNNVKEEYDVQSDTLRKMKGEFDAVIMSNTIDFLTSPREVFRSAWNLLKPNGIMMVAFSSKDAYSSKFGRAQTKMWKDMNDDQHTWICGSFFQFSAGSGWDGLKAFDISPEGAELDAETSPIGSMLNKVRGSMRPQPMFVVQATKAVVDEVIDESDPLKSIKSKMWMLPTMEDRDKELVAPRLARTFERMGGEGRRELTKGIEVLPTVYESLIKMDQFAFTFSMQAELAANLVSDPDFVASDEQVGALKMGLGLRKPSPTFWGPVGELTMNMDPNDKINLLAYLVPRFGTQHQDEQLESFVSGLEPTISYIRTKCPEMTRGDVEMLASELLASELLGRHDSNTSSRRKFAAWLNELTGEELVELLDRRKGFKGDAMKELEDMRDERKMQEKAVEKRKELMQEQVEKAREVRTVIFNTNTGRIEEIKGGNKNKK